MYISFNSVTLSTLTALSEFQSHEIVDIKNDYLFNDIRPGESRVITESYGQER